VPEASLEHAREVTGCTRRPCFDLRKQVFDEDLARQTLAEERDVLADDRAKIEEDGRVDR
jgi:hypothetical protein